MGSASHDFVQELTAISSAKAKEAKDLQAKEQDLIDTMQSLAT